MKISPINISRLVWKAREQVNRALGEKISLELTPGVTPMWVAGYPDRLRSILLAFALHARQSMPSGGSFIIAIHHADLTEREAYQLGLEPGEFCELVFSELGYLDLSQNTSDQAALNKNTVSAVEDIVFQHKGRLRVHPIVNQLPSFRLFLPLCEHGSLSGSDEQQAEKS